MNAPLAADELNARYDPMTRDELIAECERLRRESDGWAAVASTRNLNLALIAEERDQLRRALDSFAQIADEAATQWDNDNDARVGKMLIAMAGRVPGYRADIEAIHKLRRGAADVSDKPTGE